MHMHGLGKAHRIEAQVAVPSWEDAEVDGVVDEDGSRIPGREGDLWKIRVLLDEGRIEGWPAGVQARIHYKVCDAGEYWLLSADGIRIAKWKGSYVPDEFLVHGDDRLGDYIVLSVGPEGRIADYSRPEVDPRRWQLLDGTS
jgi:hypothetical protein